MPETETLPLDSADELIATLATPADYVRWAASRFEASGLAFGHGFDRALDEAFYLVRHCLCLPHDLADVYMTAQLLPSERRRLVALINRRIDERLPSAYLTGEAWFCGLRFAIDARAIVPRSPLAELIVEGFTPWLTSPPARVLDLCAGNGCIAIACAHVFPDADVDAVEYDPDTFALMQQNIAEHDLVARVQAYRGDLFAPLSAAEVVRGYDLIVTNPPYVAEAEWQALPPEYHAEPRCALTDGGDGMAIVARILRDAPAWLAEDGTLIGEIGDSTDAFEAAFPDLPAIWPTFERGGSGVFIITREALVDWLSTHPIAEERA